METLQIIGNVTKDPETRQVNTVGGPVTACTFTVAVNPRRKGSNEQKEGKFFRVTAWRKLGEVCQQYIHKGNKVYVSGTVDVNAYTNKDGKVAASLEVTAQDIEFLTSKNSTNQSNDASYVPPVNDSNAPAGFQPVEPEGLPF